MEEKRIRKSKTESNILSRKDLIEFKVSYIPFLLLDGMYEIKYSKKNVIKISLRSEVFSITIGNLTFKKTELHQLKEDLFELDFIESIIQENNAKIAIDAQGKEIKEKDIPEFQLIDKKLLEEIQKKDQIVKVRYNDKFLLEKLKSRLIKRPLDYVKIIEEKISIRYLIILRARYEGTFEINNKKKTMIIDSVTGSSTLE
ncbi:MAG: hypothetical protein ACTSSI_00055 [Candidatus Helarchaeota archaeon]